MQCRCAWCGTDMTSLAPEATSALVSHGLCADCAARLAAGPDEPLGESACGPAADDCIAP